MRVFLDHQSATPLLPEAEEAMRPFWREHFGNAASLHGGGVMARDAIEKARAQVAGLVRAESPESILFTSSGTEATNLAVKGAALANQRRGKHIVFSAAEQPAVGASI
jgi:cysteine desulfurase